MIEKKPPTVSDFPAMDEEGRLIPGVDPTEDDAAADEEHLHTDELHDHSEDDYEALDDDLDSDPEADAARRKRNGNLIFYGGIAGIVVIVGFLMYPKIEKYISPPKPQQAMGIAVPESARKNPFKNMDAEDTAKPEVPSGAGGNLPVTEPAGTIQPGQIPVAPPVATVPDVTPTGQATPFQATALPPGPLPAAGDNAGSMMAPAVAPAPASVPVQPVPAVAPQNPASQAADVKALTPEVQSHLADLSGKVDTLQASVASLSSDKNAEDAKLQQMQSTLDSLQAQIAALAEVKTTASPAASKQPAAPKTVPNHHAASPTHASKWILRSATPDMALLAQPGTNDLQRVSVGDMVSGLGRITSISDQTGHWVVKGTSGSVAQ